MITISQSDWDSYDCQNFVNNFMSEYKVSSLLTKCNATKARGVPVSTLFTYILGLVWSDRSMYMSILTGTYDQDFSKNAVYRFLDSTKTNWQKFTTCLASSLIADIKPLTSEDRADAFIVDDSLYDRSRSSETELLSVVHDHNSHKSKKGYRMCTLGYTDGNTTIPINMALLASPKDKYLLCPAKHFDGRTVAGKRRAQARRKQTDVMFELINLAQSKGIEARYVLMDSWYSYPCIIERLKTECGLDTIARLKNTPKIKYIYEGAEATLNEIYRKNKKRRGRSKYLLEVNVTLKGEDKIPAKIVYVRNTSAHNKTWCALISTNTEITAEEVIRLYGRRWDIEVFFKTIKSLLGLVKGTRSINYDALVAHTSIVFVRYMILAVAQRRSVDPKTLGHLFLEFCDELKDITFSMSLSLLMDALMKAAKDVLGLSEQKLEEFVNTFVSLLPSYMQNCLKKASFIC